MCDQEIWTRSLKCDSFAYMPSSLAKGLRSTPLIYNPWLAKMHTCIHTVRILVYRQRMGFRLCIIFTYRRGQFEIRIVTFERILPIIMELSQTMLWVQWITRCIRLVLLCLATIRLNGKIKQYSSDHLKTTKMYNEFIKIVQCICLWWNSVRQYIVNEPSARDFTSLIYFYPRLS